MAFRISLFIISVLALYQLQYSCQKLVFAVILHRHGARAPLTLYKEGYWNTTKGDLTNKGKQQMLNVGIQLRKIYVSQLKQPVDDAQEDDEESRQIVDQDDILQQVYVFSSPKNRALISCEKVMQGFLNSENENIFKFNIFTQNNFLPLQFNGIYSNEINIIVPEPQFDFLFHGAKKSVCPKTTQYLLKESQIMQAQKFQEEELIQNEWDMNLTTPQTDATNEISTVFKAMSNIGDLYLSAEYNKIADAPQFTKAQIQALIKTKRFYIYNYKFGNQKNVDFSSTKFNRALTYFFTSKMQQTQQQQQLDKLKVIFFSGHDRMIASILKSMLGQKYDYLKLNEKFLDIPFGAVYSFELHSFDIKTESFKGRLHKKSQIQKKFFVKLLFNNKEIAICDSDFLMQNQTNSQQTNHDLCSISDFLTQLDYNNLKNLDAQCYDCVKQLPDFQQCLAMKNKLF